MAYTILNSRGDTLAVVREQDVNTTATDIALHGRGRFEYGQSLNQNQVFQLENFAKFTPPTNPMPGQMWFELGGGSPANGSLYYYNPDNVSPEVPQVGPLAKWVEVITVDNLTPSLNDKVSIPGDIMTGELILFGDPTVPLGATPKQYVDAVETATNIALDTKVDEVGGNLILAADPLVPLEAATKQYVDAVEASLLLLLSGVLNAPAGTRMVFHQATTPAGWAVDATNDRMLRVASGSGGAVGGSSNPLTFNHAHSTGTLGLTVANMPRHWHRMKGPRSGAVPQGGVIGFSIYGGGTPDDGAWGYGTWSTGGGLGSGSTGVGEGNGTGHNHGNTSTALWTPRYTDVIIGVKS